MPSHTPTTFASAAAANGSNDGNAARNPSAGNDWSRSRPNGSTQTFRRSSQANMSSAAREPPQSSSAWAGNAYVPPHMNASLATPGSRSSGANETRFSKEQMLELYKNSLESRSMNGDIQAILTEGWQPGATSNASNGSWSRKDENKDHIAGPDVCWELGGVIDPLSLKSMTEEEKELFAGSVNSPLKPPPQNPNKEGVQTPGLNGRKSSFSQTAGASSLSASRPGGRRRETNDTQPSSNPLASPTPYNRSKDESPLTNPPSLLLRRRTADVKDSPSGPSFSERARVETTADNSSPFGSLKRTGPASASVHGPSSPWASSGPQSAGFGAFGNFALDTTGAPTIPSDKRVGFGSGRESRFKDLMSKGSSEDVAKKSEKNLSLLDRLGESESEGQSNSQRLYPRSTAAGRESHHILEEFDQRIGSAALGGDDGLDEDKTNDGADTDDDRHSNPYATRGPGKTFDPNFGEADRSQTSSTGPPRFAGLGGFGGLGGIGNTGAWGMGPNALGGSGRASGGFPGPFSESIFNSMGDVSSPGGVFGTPPSTGFSGIGRGSKMGSLFPQNMQDQMRNDSGFGDFTAPRNAGTPGQGILPREADGSVRAGHGVLDDLFNHADPSSRSGLAASSALSQTDPISSSTGTIGPSTTTQQSIAAPIAGPALTNPPSSSALDSSSNQMPPAQQRQMVMPDRMRWIYRDPSGNTQGPWSGLEMHDWYKAGFFSPELLVRKYEDKEYEPLAQLIRRIGNSREPFLVPQIGIPHGPPVNPPGGTNIGSVASTSGMQSGAVQPPFASNFPSFGTTLTADQQNALERRKQEEQFLMARQKEHLAHQQVIMRQFQGQGMPPHGMHPQGLHHHSSAHSLQSQPSYGSIASPAGYQGSPAPMPLQQQPAGMPNYFDRPGLTQANYGNDTGSAREPDLVASFDRLGLGRGRPSAYGSPMGQIPASGMDHQQQVATMLQDRARLQMEQEQAGISGHMTEQESIDRLEQYHQFRGEDESDELGNQIESDPDLARETIPGPDYGSFDITEQTSAPDISASGSEAAPTPMETSQAPAPSISPLPAPSAQRSRPHAAEKLNIESGSRSETPSADTPTTATIAPWAKDNVEGPKGPSLKEIQEAEARKAAQQEEIAAAARRALAEQERAAVAQAQAQNVAGLPSGANWAASSSPTTNAPSAWTKKPATSTPPAGAKKTLSQIQKEEELRKNRAAATAATNTSATATAGPGGKRYADLAGKSTVPPSSASGGAWTTVGAGGKAKAAAGSATNAPPQRTVSTGVPAPATPTSSKVTAPVRANSSASAKQTATDELQRWAKAVLGKGLNSGIDVNEFVRHLMNFPPDSEIVADSVYGNSKLLDGRRFAEEFVRRRKLADKGQVAPDGTGNFLTAGSSGESDGKPPGGWSEVAKKGGEKSGARDDATAFKVVAAKKKGKR